MAVRRVTLDTNVFPAADLVARASRLGVDIAAVSVSKREVEGSSLEEEVAAIATILESAVWGESRWGFAVWGSESTAQRLGAILEIISNSSYPVAQPRAHLSRGQLRQLRDAMIFEAHLRVGRDLFVTRDERGFVGGGRRRQLESQFATSIMTVREFEEYLSKLESAEKTW